MKKWIISVVLLALLLIGSLGLNYYQYTHPPYDIEIVETVDTFTIYKDSIIEKTIYKPKTLYDTTFIYVTETDTIEVPVEIPIDHNVYRDVLRHENDSVEVSVGYSGFKAQIDSITVIPHYQTTIIKPEKRWGWNVTGGLGVNYGINPITGKLEPNVGIGVVVGLGYRIK